jgi:L-threonylcarbamoyladenylate synthase
MTARILAATLESLRRCADALRRGAVVAMPTETVYGLAGVAWNEAAVARIFHVKDRPTLDPLIVHVATASQLAGLEVAAAPIDPRATRLATRFWPGPLTLVVPRGPRIPDLVTSGLPTVAVRVPAHPVAQALLREVGAPLAAPSANRFGRLSPTSAEDVAAELGDRIDLILDGGRCRVGLESTIVGLIRPDLPATLLRPGGLPTAAITEVLGEPLVPAAAAVDPLGAQLAPGNLPAHYAPGKRLDLLAEPVARLRSSPGGDLPPELGLLAFAGDAEAVRAQFAELTGRRVTCRVLSPRGDLEEAARRLFASLRALDASTAERLFAEPVPTREGLGLAIADRLSRAARPR